MDRDSSSGWTGYLPLDGIVTGELHRGVVREWLDDEGWGVVDCPATPGGCWTHFSAIVSGGYRRLDAGAPVRFTVERAEQDGYSYRAVQVWPASVEAGGVAEQRQHARERLIILDAFVKALDRRDDVLTVIGEADDEDAACERLAELLDVTETGANAIIDLQLRRFSRRAAARIRRERDELVALLESR